MSAAMRRAGGTVPEEACVPGEEREVPHTPEHPHDQSRGNDAIARPEPGRGEPRPADLLEDGDEQPDADSDEQDAELVIRRDDGGDVVGRP